MLRVACRQLFSCRLCGDRALKRPASASSARAIAGERDAFHASGFSACTPKATRVPGAHDHEREVLGSSMGRPLMPMTRLDHNPEKCSNGKTLIVRQNRELFHWLPRSFEFPEIPTGDPLGTFGRCSLYRSLVSMWPSSPLNFTKADAAGSVNCTSCRNASPPAWQRK
jgi:hypothetical protein